MAVSVTLSGGGSIIAWQTPSGVSFQRFDASHQPIGAVTSVATGPTVWLSASALADGGFSIVWDVNASSIPTVQNYDANGVASGSTYSVATPPIADIAFTSRAFDQVRNSAGQLESATALLPDGGSVVVSSSFVTINNGIFPAVSVQRYDAAGNQIGSGSEQIGYLMQWYDFSVTPLPDGGYAVGYAFTNRAGSYWSGQRFDADGTLLGGIYPTNQTGGLLPGLGSFEIAGLPNGNIVLAWSTFDGLHVLEYNAAGQPVSTEQLFASQFSGASTLAIDVFPDGDYVITFSRATGAQYFTLTASGASVPPADNDLIATIAPTYTLPVGPHDVTLTGNWAQSVTGNVLDNIITSNDYISTLNGAAGNDTLIAGHDANILTGGAGADTYKFLYLPWSNTGHITDFALGIDRLDFSALFAASGYTGSNPVADGYIRFESDGAGGTRVQFDADGPGGNPWPFLVTTLDHVSPNGLTAAQLFNPAGSPPPPPTTGKTLTANDTRDQSLVGGSGDDIFYAGHNSVVMTGGAGADTYKFLYFPWNNTGHITDFALGIDKLDFSALFTASGYTGSNPVADGYIRFESDGTGGTRVQFDADGPGGYPWPFLVTTLDHVSPSGLTAAQLFNGASSPPPPPPPPPPTTGKTLTANDTRDQILVGGSGDDVFYAGHNSVVMTGGAGADTFKYLYPPWNNTGHITDFAPGIDKLDFTALFAASGYIGSNPVADGYLRFESDGSGGTRVQFDADGPGGYPWPFLITTLDHVQPSGVHSGDWLFA